MLLRPIHVSGRDILAVTTGHGRLLNTTTSKVFNISYKFESFRGTKVDAVINIYRKQNNIFLIF